MLLWTWVYRHLLESLLSTLGYILRIGTVGSSGHSIFIFWGTALLFSIATVPFYILTSNTLVPISPYPCQHLLFSGFLRMTILMGVKLWLLVVTFVLNCSIKQGFGVLFRCWKETSGLTEERVFPSTPIPLPLLSFKPSLPGPAHRPLISPHPSPATVWTTQWRFIKCHLIYYFRHMPFWSN